MSNYNNEIVCLKVEKSDSKGANSDFSQYKVLKYMEVVRISCY
jgi:hypothetical protein